MRIQGTTLAILVALVRGAHADVSESGTILIGSTSTFQGQVKLSSSTEYSGIGNVVAPVGKGVIFYSSSQNKLLLSENGGSPMPLAPNGCAFVSSQTFASVSSVTFSGLASSTTYKVDFTLKSSSTSVLAFYVNSDGTGTSHYTEGGGRQYINGTSAWGNSGYGIWSVSADNDPGNQTCRWVGQLTMAYYDSQIEGFANFVGCDGAGNPNLYRSMFRDGSHGAAGLASFTMYSMVGNSNLAQKGLITGAITLCKEGI